MQTLSLSLRSRGEEGEPLPPVFHQLEALGARFRRGWLHLIGAAPGAGKSAMTSFLALSLDYTGYGDKVPGLYLSPDNDVLTWGKNALAFATKTHVNAAEERLVELDDNVVSTLDDASDHLWISFQPSPSPLDIREEIDAFATVYGEWPHFVVIDNLMDVDGSSGGFGSEHTTQDGILEFLKRVGRETGAAIIVLCHVTGEYTDGRVPIPRSGLMNKLDKRPQLIATLYLPDEENLLGVCVVKNRAGMARADGTLQTFIPWLPEMAWMSTGEEDGDE